MRQTEGRSARTQVLILSANNLSPHKRSTHTHTHTHTHTSSSPAWRGSQASCGRPWMGPSREMQSVYCTSVAQQQRCSQYTVLLWPSKRDACSQYTSVAQMEAVGWILWAAESCGFSKWIRIRAVLPLPLPLLAAQRPSGRQKRPSLKPSHIHIHMPSFHTEEIEDRRGSSALARAASLLSQHI